MTKALRGFFITKKAPDILALYYVNTIARRNFAPQRHGVFFRFVEGYSTPSQGLNQ